MASHILGMQASQGSAILPKMYFDIDIQIQDILMWRHKWYIEERA